MNKDWKKAPVTRQGASGHWVPTPNRFRLTASKTMAIGYECDNGILIEAGFHYNGSGGNAFGGAKDWPVIDCQINFESGRIAERNLFIKKLQKFLDENL